MASHMIADLDFRLDEEPVRCSFDDFLAVIKRRNEGATGAPKVENYVYAYANGEPIGGLKYRTYVPDAYLDFLGVLEPHQKCGVGAALVARLEAHLAEKGCRRLFVDTLEFQAPLFYQKLGFSIVAEIKNYMHEWSRFILVKQLAQRK